MNVKLVFIPVVFLLILTSVFAQPVNTVQLTGYVNDYTNTLTQAEQQALSNIAQSLHTNNKAETAIVIVDNFDGLSKEEYALAIAHTKLGNTQSDNGLLILIGLDIREYRIEVGYGLEGDLNDAKVGRIARETLLPQFQQEQYAKGLLNLLATIHQELLPDVNQQDALTYATPVADINIHPLVYVLVENPFIMIVGFIMLSRVVGLFFRGKNPSKKRNDDDTLNAALLASIFFRGGGGGGLGGSGGFGGFGGGGFGGGGAGGRW